MVIIKRYMFLSSGLTRTYIVKTKKAVVTRRLSVDVLVVLHRLAYFNAINVAVEKSTLSEPL